MPGSDVIPWRQHHARLVASVGLGGFRELVGILRERRFDLVHTHNPKPGVFGRIGARMAGVPHVFNTVHGYYATPDRSASSAELPVMSAEWFAARFSDLELFQSAEDMAWSRAS